MHLKKIRNGILGIKYMNSYETIVGMEIHVELKTKSKMFCGCKNDPFFAVKPNIYTCPVCLGLPGALPVPNRQAIEWTLRLGLALGAEIPLFSKFDRKNYFYPDLAKGYQISQYDQPFCKGGNIKTSTGTVRIHRVHLEEDTGKLLHTEIDNKKVTLIDFNRSGIPLVEIVTEPDIRSGEQAKEFLKKLQQIIRYLDISDADMEKGSMRLEPNISVRKSNIRDFPKYKVEVKNINSFNFVKKAIDYETKRQTEILNKQLMPVQETRGWNETKGVTFSQRVKENADDYRYFPDPDIPPLRWTPEYIDYLKTTLPELADVKQNRFSRDYNLNEYDSALLTETVKMSDYFDEAVRISQKLTNPKTPKTIANWIINRRVNIDEVLPADLIKRINAAESVSPISESDLSNIIRSVCAENSKAISDYKNGRQGAIMFLLGQVKIREKNASPEQIIRLLKNILDS